MDIYNERIKRKNYFSLRDAAISHTPSSLFLPSYFKYFLPRNKNAPILDIGCGFCQTLIQFRDITYTNLMGIDISDEAIAYGKSQNLNVEKITDIESFSAQNNQKFDLIILSHVIEHIEKSRIIQTLQIVREKLLSEKGRLFIRVPNAQSNTHAYWAYEDFTHTTIFSTGSLNYVLKAAGFVNIKYIDPYDLNDRNKIKAFFIKLFLKLYTWNKIFWNKITNSSFHAESPNIFSFELKVIAS